MMWRSRIGCRCRPSTWAAATYGFSRSTSTRARVSRAGSGHCAMAMTSVITGIDGPNRATTSSSISSSGSDICASSRRETTVSTQPPK